jgi:ribosomal protein S18 acetylase RimI-like enzyme
MSAYTIRPVYESDLPQLMEIETSCFEIDRLSRRSFHHWLKVPHRIFLVAEQDGELIGYGLVLLYKGTRLARLYSLAVCSTARGSGTGRALLEQLEEKAAGRGRLYMRLEVSRNNRPAISLYESAGYRVFGFYRDYYEDHIDALRMHKRIRFPSADLSFPPIPWYRQTTDFTCGPAALMMAMTGVNPELELNQFLELDIWREATTIFMTSGHGGAHPLGLALAAFRRGFQVKVVTSRKKGPFIEGVRSLHKKEIMSVVDRQFRQRAEEAGIPVICRQVSAKDIEHWLMSGLAVVMLVSTYRINGSKSPHWVAVTAIDDQCLYVHDPDPLDETQGELECRDVPIARADFEKMSSYGSSRLRVAVVVGPYIGTR